MYEVTTSNLTLTLCAQYLASCKAVTAKPMGDQPRGHRTVYFHDPEGNLLEIYAEI